MVPLDQFAESLTSPATVIAQWIESEGMSKKDAALALQWKPPELSMILSGVRPISERMARDLAETLSDIPQFKGWTPEDWMELQREYNVRAKSPDAEFEFWAAKERGGTLCDADILDSVKSGLLRIEDFDENAVQPASYDPKPGTITWYRRRDKNGNRLTVKLEGDAEEVITPGQTAMIETKEKFRMPPNMVGRLASAGWLVDAGVQFTFGLHLEPGWVGHPFFLLTHNGDEDIKIGAAYVCASIEFEFLQRPARKPFGSRRKVTG